MGFIEEVLDATSESESPTSFYYWSSLAAIAATVRGNVFLSTHGGMVKYYPNLFVLLIAKSGLRKGHPVILAKELVQTLNVTRVISGRSSVEAIIGKLGRTHTTSNGGPPSVDACGFVVNDEFSTALIKNPDALTMLTTLYDTQYHSTWEYDLKHSGVVTLKRPCVTILGALNQPHFQDMITQKDLEGGFIGRCLLVIEEKRSKINSGLDESILPFDITKAQQKLEKISHLKGEVRWTPEAKAIYQPWYDAWRPEELEDRTGTANRLHAQILKVATCLSLSHRDDLFLGGDDMQMAMDSCLEFTQNANKASIGQGRSEFAAKTAIVLKALLKAEGHKLSRQTILRNNWGELDSIDLDRIVQTMDQAGWIKASREGGDSVYLLLPHVVNEYKSNKGKE